MTDAEERLMLKAVLEVDKGCLAFIDALIRCRPDLIKHVSALCSNSDRTSPIYPVHIKKS